MAEYDVSDRKIENYYVKMIYATYTDILFILFPFIVVGLQRIWNGEGINVLKYADLSIVSAILAGMTIGKLVLALVGDKSLKPYKEYIVYGIALTLFSILGPSIVLIVKIMGNGYVPAYVVFVQPVLLIMAVTFYSSAVSIGNILPKLAIRPEVADKAGV